VCDGRLVFDVCVFFFIAGSPASSKGLSLGTGPDNALLARLVPALQSLDVHGAHAVTCVLRVLLHHTLGISLLEAGDADDLSIIAATPSLGPGAAPGDGASGAVGAVGALRAPTTASSTSMPLHTVGPTPAFALPRASLVGAGSSVGAGAGGGYTDDRDGVPELLQGCAALIGSLVENILEVLAALQLASEGEVREACGGGVCAWGVQACGCV
jgi:hypothetical protein